MTKSRHPSRTARVLLYIAFVTVLLTSVTCQGNVYVGVSTAGPYAGYPYGGHPYGYGGGVVVVGRPYP